MATFNVDTPNDIIDAGDSVTSLREAIIAANASAGDDEITLPADTYTLTLAGSGEDGSATGDLDITDTAGKLTVRGQGWVTIKNGYLEVPSAPGFGVELNEAEAAKYPYADRNFLRLFEGGWEKRKGQEK